MNGLDLFMRGHTGKKKSDHPCWKGGKIIDKDGYIRTWSPEHPWPRKGYIMEHVRIIELKIGRRLTSKETVHHIDHDRKNNNENNLQLMTRSEHSKLHRSMDAHKFTRCKNGRFSCG